MKNVVCEMQHITKSFLGVAALSDVSIKFYAGEIHGLLGCNGAGKSTLVKILSGYIQPDSGAILLDGKPFHFSSTNDAYRMGIALSSQETMLFSDMTVEENLFMILPSVRGQFFVDYNRIHAEAKAILQRIHVNVDPRRKVSTLSHSEKYMIQFARCYLQRPRIMILDELSSSLTNAEISIVHKLIDELKKSGAAILYITQRMSDILMVSDRITVLRDGKIVYMPEKNISQAELRSYIYGKVINHVYPKLPLTFGEEILTVSNLSNQYIHDISFKLHRGEIIGVMGNSGSGRSRMLRALAGIDALKSGHIFYNGTELHSQDAKEFRNIAYLPEDREKQGLFLKMNCNKNITIRNLDKVTNYGRLQLSAENLICQNTIDRLGIKKAYPDTAEYLSGGNKQKLIVARFLYSNCSVYLFDEPTQGIDAVGRVEIYNIISELARKGAGIILVSSDFAELLGMCDSLLLMKGGAIVTQCSPDAVIQKEL